MITTPPTSARRIGSRDDPGHPGATPRAVGDRGDLAAAGEEVRAARVVAESADRLVRVTVVGGQVKDLWFDPAAYRRHEPAHLANLTLETITEAIRLFHERANARYRSVLGPGFDLADLVQPPTEQGAEERVRAVSRRLFGTP